MNFLFVIRLKQFYRTILELGLVRSLFFIAGLAFFYYLHLKYYWLNESFIIPTLYLFVLVSIHLKRVDKNFLNLFAKHASFSIFIEYLFISSPLIILALIKIQFINALILILSCFLISYFLRLSFNQFRFITLNYKFRLVEWYLGMRRNAFLIFLLNVIAIAMFHHFSAQIIVSILLSFILMSFFLHSESKEILEVFSSEPGKFLKKKISIHILYTSFSILIPMLIILIFHIELFYVAGVIVVLIIGMQTFAIYLKYAFYEPGEELPQNTIFQVLFFIGFVLPFLTPIAIYFLIKFRIKALENLNFYLNDTY